MTRLAARPLYAAAVALAVLSAVGCAPPRVRVDRMQPPRFMLPKTLKVALVVEAMPGEKAPTEVVGTLMGVARGQVLPAEVATESVKSEWAPMLVREGYTLVPKEEAQAIVRVRPLKWAFALDRRLGNITDGGGRLDVRLEVFDVKQPDRALFTETYWATARTNLGEPEALLRASRRIGDVFLGDLRPTRVASVVELDDSDKAVDAGVKLAKEGQLDAAYQAFTDAIARAPTSAPAHYNLAVMTESRGSYEQAEQLLLKATQLAPKPLYYTALERVRQAKADAQALQLQ